MADFLLTEAVDEDVATAADSDDEGNIVNMTLSDKEFIDDSVIDESLTDYYGFPNVSRDYAQAVEDSFSDFDYDQEPNNYCNEDEFDNLKIDDFKDYKSKLINLQKHYSIHKVSAIKIPFFILFCLR